MSGPKAGVVVLSPLGLIIGAGAALAVVLAAAERQRAAAAQARERNRQSLQHAIDRETRAAASELYASEVRGLEAWMKQLRADCGSFKGAVGSVAPATAKEIDKALRKLERGREDLALAIGEARSLSEAYDAAASRARAALDAAKKATARRGAALRNAEVLERELRDSGDAVSRAVTAYERELGRLERKRQELEGLRASVASRLAPGTSSDAPPRAPSDGGWTAADAAAEASNEAARRELEALAAEVTSPPDEGWETVDRWAGGGPKSAELQRTIADAVSQLGQSDTDAARALLAGAADEKRKLLERARSNQAAGERVKSIADAVMQALCDRRYDTPLYGPIVEGDPLSGVQIRADVPNPDGRGNIRIDLHLDGRAEFEVSNVPEGEERICRDVLGGLAEGLGEQLELQVTSWGRAATAEDEQIELQRQSDSARQRDREDGGSRSRGREA